MSVILDFLRGSSGAPTAADAPDGAAMAAEEYATALIERGLDREDADELIAQVNLDFAALRVEAVRRGLEVGE